ncbi:manganese catalase family protein [Caproiciproducens sp. CPB-2]|uniref:manganese catalase family protein n=1 Tax=Caproiciproducens sp. CPB-2 TaxID=3030017 RepID=UPI0023DC44E8|nr:manganese catalase family protein [Caproiciproducens sp. CPB-2]MDF1494855.1 manganese catalase family protein [Caproiciproducens sp. CPB-2]
MWNYQKNLQYPINIKNTNPKLAQIIIAQYGGPDGELAASLRYLSQRFSMPYPELKAILTDIGTEELAHLEMVGTIVHQLTRNLTEEQIKEGGFDAYFVNHTTGVYPADSSGTPFTAAYLQVKGDPITDIHEDLAADAAIAKERLIKKFMIGQAVSATIRIRKLMESTIRVSDKNIRFS